MGQFGSPQRPHASAAHWSLPRRARWSSPPTCPRWAATPSCSTASSRPTPPSPWRSSSTAAASGRVSGCGGQWGRSLDEGPVAILPTQCGSVAHAAQSTAPVAWLGVTGPHPPAPAVSRQTRCPHVLCRAQPPGPFPPCSSHLARELGLAHRTHGRARARHGRPGDSTRVPVCLSPPGHAQGPAHVTTADGHRARGRSSLVPAGARTRLRARAVCVWGTHWFSYCSRPRQRQLLPTRLRLPCPGAVRGPGPPGRDRQRAHCDRAGARGPVALAGES